VSGISKPSEQNKWHMSKQEEFYKKLKESLEASTEFPTTYLYKFIVPTTKNQLNEVKSVFEMSGGILKTKSSKTNKYVSISISVKMNSSSAIIEKYQQVSHIEGIVSL
jgi:putative lipoic acid-binding regulatory protein